MMTIPWRPMPTEHEVGEEDEEEEEIEEVPVMTMYTCTRILMIS